jgi:prepilin-type N-terminal cleavage/methylation domain-containing protein/prepilin-type processing-associated H-X9-DG protein
MTVRKRGFTLIELLVVIAIIAILAAILFPVFARARSKAEQASCLANIKQIMLATFMYASDYDQTLMPTAGGWYNMLNPYTQNSAMYFCAGASWDSNWLGTVAIPPWTCQVMYPGYLTNNAYLGGTKDQQWAGKSLDYFSSVSHFALWVEGQSLAPLNGETANGVAVNYQETDITKAPNFTVWFDGFFPGWSVAGTVYSPVGDPTADPPYWGVPSLYPAAVYQGTNQGNAGCLGGNLEARHNGFMNVGFLDGHAKAVSLVDLYTQDTTAVGTSVKGYYMDASSKVPNVGQALP